jgi:DNA polymerase-3 subunit delta
VASWNFEQFVKHVEKGETHPFYLFYGDEIYLTEDALKKIKSKVFEDSLADFNLDNFYGGELDVDDLGGALETLPMMGQKRLVILKDAHLLKTAELEKIAEFVSVPIETTIFVAVFESVDQRKKIFKDLFKKMTVVEFSEIGERYIPSWIDRITRSYGKTIAPQVAAALQNLVGNRLIDLNNEINKLALFIGEKKEIDTADIEAVVSKYRIDSVFELTNAIAAKHTEKALKIQKYLLDNGESEVGILAMVTRHMRILLLTQEALQKRMNGSALSQYVGVPPYFVNQYIQNSKDWPYNKLTKAYQKLLETDRNLKSSSIASQNFLVDTLMGLTT